MLRCKIGLHDFKKIASKKGISTVGNIFGNNECDSMLILKQCCNCPKKKILAKTNKNTFNMNVDMYINEFEGT